jgi:hypothetical protein
VRLFRYSAFRVKVLCIFDANREQLSVAVTAVSCQTAVHRSAVRRQFIAQLSVAQLHSVGIGSTGQSYVG